MGSSCCKVGNSKYRHQYERFRLKEDKTLEELAEIAENRFDEDISRQTFWRHFKKHDLLTEIEDDQKEKVKDEVEEALDVSKELRQNLGILRNMAGRLIEKDNDLEAQDMRAANQLLKEIRLTVTKLSELTNQLRIEDINQDDEMDEFFEVLDELEPEMHQAIVEIIDDDLER